MTREARVAAAQATIFSILDNKQKEIIELVLSKYNETGVEELIFTGNIPRKTSTSLNLRWKLRTSSHWFESGFPGFIGLTITSLVWVERLLLNGAFIYRPFADALRIGEKKGTR